MSLYDDIDESKAKGWNTSAKFLSSMQSQLQLKKTMIAQPKREVIRRTFPNSSSHHISGKATSEVTFKTESVDKKSNNDVHHVALTSISNVIQPKEEKLALYSGLDWDINFEYNPLHPTDYDRLTRERRERRGMEIEIEEAEKNKRRTVKEETREVKNKDRTSTTGFAGRVNLEDDDIEGSTIIIKKNSSVGVAIAPPPSLQDSSSSTLNSSGIGVAQKIMAKYGFKEGSGLGRKEQGLTAALQVEKTSGTKNRGRIITETEMPPGLPLQTTSKPEQTIAEIMKNPSKVICLRNMVGPGSVDDDLEPEVREECQVKYGDVNKVIVYEIPNTSEDEAVRIFVEFKRIESAIKAVIDLNGRFFAGRQVKAGFYDVEKFLAMELNE